MSGNIGEVMPGEMRRGKAAGSGCKMLPLHKFSVMPAFVIVEITVHDREEIVEYQKQTPAVIAAFGGKFIVRGGKTTTLEGGWTPERIVVIEFPTVEKANEWWNSEMYSPVKAIRQRAANTKMIIIEGV
jgi:uncharacterized protein (DUF1330 family)